MPTDEKFEAFVNETMEKVYRSVIGGLADSVSKIHAGTGIEIEDEHVEVIYNLVIDKLEDFFKTVALDEEVVKSTSKLMAAVLKEEIDSSYMVKFGAEAH